ncbi:MAG: aspartate carbamoyltransferase [Armatimonadetes bacterium CG2_30_59_28]|nr:aspartate carbamoyltransferase catalytic subunit [Armatimonadota bacterium]OIO92696.1 MAG: aspartate carbamoyltransferase [Armatimonadetes bacterium CG2_30_59_28]PIU65109.1 MAG: aspartate carbamoyltransferase [Armatimonadetes bacterium CG07_land_8_20_14_0_80_59_28]PIX43434.1 MAG: aspartate carbamoyltransferase [Armatimonadetes bacterium CG_4_8_14_3_um_filter_58_9]PIY39615.1 MAG: aspartate carbamoyltransferase [Armatimonadetes bacterium CG_4_10_14_3_um_filter_59_10]PJB77648.1 MAG: aspartate 
MLHRKDLLGLQETSVEEIQLILDTAEGMKQILSRPIPKVPTLRGKTVCTLFYEASTRTRTSFEGAAKALGADTMSLTVAASSVTKGETLKDTILTVSSLGPHAIVMRHKMSGSPHFAAKYTKAHVINAGDGCHEHPTQGLLDLFTVREKKGRVEGLQIAIIGDILHSRVARSDIWGYTKMGASVRLCGPSTLMPVEIEKTGVTVCRRIEEAIEGVDVVYMLRIQLERQQAGLFPSVLEYARLFGMNPKRLELAAPEAIVMHPGPINRGIEISAEMADSDRTVILDQVTNGLAVRMAVLYLLLGGGASPDEGTDET